MDRRKFITTVIAGGLLSATCIIGSKYYFGKSREIELRNNIKKEDLIPALDVHLVEHCNLRCKYCCHFSCIAEEAFLDIRKFKKDLKRLIKITDGKLDGFILLGGEPLLHPKINDFIKLIRKNLPNCYIQVLTNGLLLNSMNDEFWKCLHENSVVLRHSLYPFKQDIDKYYEKVEKYDVKTYFSKEELKQNEIKKFFRLNIHLKKPEDYIERFKNCNNKVYCAQLYDGKIYSCWLGQGIRHFNKKFNQNIPVTEKDYLDIYKINSAEEIKEFFAKPFPLCGYCGEPYINENWGTTKEHNITEWTYEFD